MRVLERCHEGRLRVGIGEGHQGSGVVARRDLECAQLGPDHEVGPEFARLAVERRQLLKVVGLRLDDADHRLAPRHTLADDEVDALAHQDKEQGSGKRRQERASRAEFDDVRNPEIGQPDHIAAHPNAPERGHTHDPRNLRLGQRKVGRQERQQARLERDRKRGRNKRKPNGPVARHAHGHARRAHGQAEDDEPEVVPAWVPIQDCGRIQQTHAADLRGGQHGRHASRKRPRHAAPPGPHQDGNQTEEAEGPNALGRQRGDEQRGRKTRCDQAQEGRFQHTSQTRSHAPV